MLKLIRLRSKCSRYVKSFIRILGKIIDFLNIILQAPPKVEIEKEKEKDKDEDDGAQPSSAPVHTPPAPPAIPSPAKLPTAPPPVEKPVTPSPSASPLPSPVSSPAPQLVQKPTTPTDASKPFVAQPPFAPNLGAQTGMVCKLKNEFLV